MLRTFVLAAGVAFVLGAIVVAVAAPHLWPLGLELILFGMLMIAGLIFERHYRGRTAIGNARVQQTGERFVDPTSGKLTEVLYDPKTGERIYRECP